MNTQNFSVLFGQSSDDYQFIPTAKGYNNEKQLELFQVKEKNHFSFIDEKINSFQKGNEILPAKALPFKIFSVLKNNTSKDELIDLIQHEEAIFSGGEGLSLVWQKDKSFFTFDKTFISPVKKLNGEISFFCLERSLPHGGESAEFISADLKEFNVNHKIILFYDFSKIFKTFTA